MSTSRLSCLVAAAAASLLLAACGGNDVSDLESKLEENFKEQTGVAAKSVTCPEDEAGDAAKGDEFTCDVEGADGNKGKATVEVRDDDLNYAVTFTEAAK